MNSHSRLCGLTFLCWLLVIVIFAGLSASATPKTMAQSDVEIIVDNRDPAFSTEGWWFIGDGGYSYNGDCAWAPRGIQNIAYVQPELPVAGSYEIFAWWCGDPNHDQSRYVRMQVHPTVGEIATYPAYVNLKENAGQWNSLGTYYLEQDGFLSVDGNLYGNVVADAFRFVYRSSEQVVITPTPMPTPIVWTTHPPTPLEQVSAGDLSARLSLTQWLLAHTPITSMEETTFDDCQAFPREGCGGTRQGWHAQVQYQDMLVPYRVSQNYRLVAVEPTEALASRQVLYLYGSRYSAQDSYLFRVDHYPDDTWHFSVSYLDPANSSPAFLQLDAEVYHLQLDVEMVERLRSFVQMYNSVDFETPDGIWMRLYGLGERVELSKEAQDQLATLAAELVTTVR